MGNKILIIDDNLASAEALAAVLEMVAHPARIAHGALEDSCGNQFSAGLGILGFGHAKMNGYEVSAQIRRDGTTEQPYSIAYTAWNDQATIKLTAAAGFDRHIAETSSFEGLVAAIKDVTALRLGGATPLM